MITIEITVDVSNWRVEKWRNDKKLYDDATELLKEIPRKTGGVYHIYKDSELMYIGCTVNFHSRLADHLVVNTNTKDFINEATHIKCVFIEDKDEREIKEYLDIKNMKPLKNKMLPRLKPHQKLLIEEDSEWKR